MRSYLRVVWVGPGGAGLCSAQAAPANAGCVGFSGTADGFDQETGVSRAQLALADAINQYKAAKKIRLRHRDAHAREAAALLARQRAAPDLLLQAGHRESEFLHRLLARRGLALCLHLGRQSLLV